MAKKEPTGPSIGSMPGAAIIITAAVTIICLLSVIGAALKAWLVP